VESKGQTRETDVSLVIPVYNEETRLPRALNSLLDFLGTQGFSWEILIVDDGSIDRTAEIAKEVAEKTGQLHYLHTPHRGKGHAVRTGMLAAGGTFRFYSDADLSVPIDDLSRFLPALEQADVAIGSREAAGAVRFNEPRYRHAIGRVYNLLVRILLTPGLQDTQCGFKGFRGDVARELFSRQAMEDWGFDVEILYLAQRLGYRIAEVPVHWTYGRHSRIRVLRDIWRMFRDVWRVRWRAWTRQYDPR
jgi:dolichyl-phosphate beta-glucosyltransferase